MNRRHLLASVLAALILPALALPAGAADTASWPTRPIKIVVAYPPGGSTDIAARLLAERLGAILGEQVIVENRGGAGGTIGALSVVRAEPDGYTLLFAASPEVSIAPITFKALPYDPVKDLMPITLVGKVPFFLVTNPGFAPKTLQELIAYAKAHPGQVNYSSYGNNTSNHLFGELFKSVAGIDTVHVPYKGSGPSIIDLMTGQVQYTFDTPAATLGHIRAGKLRAIAVATPERLAVAPDVPTMSESGLKGFVGGTWFGLLAPAKTPQPIIDKVHQAVVKALATPQLHKAFDDKVIIPGGDTPAEFGAFIKSEVARWHDLAARIGLQPQ